MSEVTCAAHKTFGRGFGNELQLVKLTWNFANDTGEADDTYKLGTVDGKILVVGSWVEVETTCAGASGTMIIGVKSGDVDAFLDITSGAVANLAAGFVDKETTGQGIVLADGAVILADIATTDFSAGKVHLHLLYVNAAP